MLNDLTYVTAIPIPETNSSFSSANYRSKLQRDQSSYKLPEGQRPSDVDENTVRKLLDQGFTKGKTSIQCSTKFCIQRKLKTEYIRSTGLAKSLSLTKLSFPLRIWIVDNSGSMQKSDGNRVVPTKEKGLVKIVPCTR